ncbi:MAG TPA: hypothetical protein VKA69_04160 [Desulfobacteria bacterium]|nr:hypothetical protein [Desulfobacteria bacterium]
MDEKGESSNKGEAAPQPSELDEIVFENLEETSLSAADSVKPDEEKAAKHRSAEADSFAGLSEEETDEFDLTHDPDLDWDDEQILEDSGHNRRKRWVVAGILATVIAAFSFTLWWCFFIKDPPFPLPDALKILKRQPTTEGEDKTSVATFKQEIQKKGFTVKGTGVDMPLQAHDVEKNSSQSSLSAGESANQVIHRELSEAAALRRELLKKQLEVGRLQQTYRERIDAVEEAILDEKRRAKVNTFAQAIKVKPIEYGLLTIHRRKTYISNLNIPIEQLHFAGEELLYLERLAGIQLKMLHIAKGIDLEALTKKIDQSLRKHQNLLNSLTVQTDEVPSPNLEKIWKEVLRNGEKMPVTDNRAPKNSHPQLQAQINRKILEEILEGKLSRKGELTRLTPEGASALSEWSGKVLDLSRLSSLQPSTAAGLARWEGHWLCLNGVKKISPETARRLSKWPGKRLSLNGLKFVSLEAARELSNWEGMELEMVGLVEAPTEAFNHLENWEHSGKKIYLPEYYKKANQTR